MFVRKSDDNELRHEMNSVVPKEVAVSITPTVLWDRAACSGGEGFGHVDGLLIESELMTAKAGVATVVCEGPRASAFSSSSALVCKVKRVTAAAAPSGSSTNTTDESVPAQDAGASDSGAAPAQQPPSSWEGMSCKMSVTHLPTK